MQPGEERYWQLAEKWMNGTITPEEMNEFSAWYNEGAEKDLQLPGEFAASREELEKRIWNRIEKARKPSGRASVVMFRRIAAAAIVLLIAGAFYFILEKKSAVSESSAELLAQATDVQAPSVAKAVLTLQDGRRFYLDSAGNGLITMAGSTSITKTGDGKLSYEGTQSAGELVFNTLEVPRGSKVVSLVLSDGTRVWLNAESSLRFPVNFQDSERKVELSGEAYFEVAKETERPFRVQCGEHVTQVLGTHFNINTYPDEMNGKVTLLEGSVRVSRRNNPISVTLRPQEQVQLGPELKKTTGVDVDAVVAWKNGMFSFDNTSIASITRQISRWYDLDVEFVDDVRDKHFTGSIGRHESVREVLHLLELTDVIHFKIEGKTLRIYK